MGTIKLDAEEFSNTYAAINKASNTDVLDAMKALSAVLKTQEGESEIADQAMDACRSLADSYNNGFYESLVGLKKTFGELFDMAEWMQRNANIGGVSKTDTAFNAGKIDASKVMV